jgi:hypothetical protein
MPARKPQKQQPRVAREEELYRDAEGAQSFEDGGKAEGLGEDHPLRQDVPPQPSKKDKS